MQIVIVLVVLLVAATIALIVFLVRHTSEEPAPKAAPPSPSRPAEKPARQTTSMARAKSTEEGPDAALVAYGESLPLHAKRREVVDEVPDEEVVQKRIHLDEDVIEDIKEHLAQIPPLPLVVTRLVGELTNPKSSAKSVAEIASSDPVLAATLLRAINSSFYGITNEITDVRQAIALLGFDTVQTLVMQFGLAKMFKGRDDEVGYNTEDLWIHSLSVSLIAMTLARKIPNIDKGFVATFGLMHDVGKLAINAKFPDKVGELFSEKMSGESFLKREERLFGADHAFIGAFLGREWDLPEDLIQAIQWHHFPKFAPLDQLDERVRRALMLIHIANQIAKFCHVYSEDMEIDLVPDEFFAALGLPGSIEENIDREVKAAINRSIFFVDQITDRPLRAVQRILRARSARDLMGVSRLPLNNPHLAKVEITEFLGQIEVPIDGSEPRVIEVGGVKGTRDGPKAGDSDLLFVCPGEEKAARQLVALCKDALACGDLSKEIRFPYFFLCKFLIGNVLVLGQGNEGVKLRLHWTEDQVDLMIESPALAFDNVIDLAPVLAKHGRDVAFLRCRALLVAGLGNVLTLDWVNRVEANPTGTRLLFQRKR